MKDYKYDAFGSIIRQDWDISEKLIFDKCYYLALDVYLRGGSFSELYRRELTKEYMKSLFSSTKDSDLLNRAESLIQTDNDLITRTLDNICQIYNEAPERELDEKKLDLLRNIDFDDFMHKVNINAKFIGKLLIRVNFLNDIVLETYTPAFYDVEKDRNKVINKVTILEYSEKKVKTMIANPSEISNGLLVNKKVWTRENNKIIYRKYEDSEIVEQLEVKTIPFVEVEFNSCNSYDAYDQSGGMYGLLEAQLTANMVKFGTIVNTMYSNNSFLLVRNIVLDGVDSLGLGSILNPPPYTDEDPEPNIEFVNPNQTYNDIFSFYKDFTNEKMRQIGLPNGLITGSNGQSGISLIIDRKELDEKRVTDIKVLREYDKLIIEKINEVSAIYGKPYDIPEHSVIYQDNSTIYTTDEQIVINNYEMDNGLISIIDLARRKGEQGTDEEIINKILKNKEINGRVTNTTAGTNRELESETDEVISDGASGVENGNNGNETDVSENDGNEN